MSTIITSTGSGYITKAVGYEHVVVECRGLPEFHYIGASKNTLYGPTSHLKAVILHFCSHDGASLTIQFRSPIWGPTCAGGFRIKFVQRFYGNEALAFLGVSVGHICVDLRSQNKFDVFVLMDTEIKEPIEITGTGKLFRVLHCKWIGVGEVRICVVLDHLYSEVGINEHGFKCKTGGAIEGLLLRVCWRIGRIFVDRNRIFG